MMPQHLKKHDKKSRRVKYPGIIEASRVLKVNRSHLYRVLEGERRSPRIEAYFAKLNRKKFTTNLRQGSGGQAESAENTEGGGR